MQQPEKHVPRTKGDGTGCMAMQNPDAGLSRLTIVNAVCGRMKAALREVQK